MDRVATNHDHCNGQQSSSSRDERDDESTAEVVADLSRREFTGRVQIHNINIIIIKIN